MYQDAQETRDWGFIVGLISRHLPLDNIDEQRLRCVGLVLRHLCDDPHRLPDPISEAAVKLVDEWAWVEKNRPDLIHVD